MTVTVGLPFRNNARTLELAVRSIFAQSTTDWRLLLVDDGSTDASLTLACRIEDPRVTVLSDGRSLGLSRRLNQIASATDTAILARMDADDLMHPDRLARQRAVLDASPRSDLVASEAYAIDADTDVRGMFRRRPFPDTPAGFLQNGFIIHPTVTGRTEWFLRYPYDPNFSKAQDKELWCRAHATLCATMLPEPLFFYRVIGNVPWEKYRLTCRYDRKVIRQHGPALAGELQTRIMVGRSYLKGALHFGLSVIGRTDDLVGRRIDDIDDDCAAEGARLIAQIVGAEVPGWPSGSVIRGGDCLSNRLLVPSGRA